MGEFGISGLIKEGELEKLEQCDVKLIKIKNTYVDVAKELAKGLKMEIETPKELDKLFALYAAQTKKAQEANDQLNETVKKQEEIISRVNESISEHIVELGKENAKKREVYQTDKNALAIALDIVGARGQNIESLVRINAELKTVTEAQKQLNDAEKKGTLASDELLKRRQSLLERERTLKTAKSELNNILSREEKLSQAAAGSYDQLSHRLELMKRAYKQMNQVEKDSPNGKILAAEIQKADKHLKELAADMGEFQRNVGNYASALDSEYAPAIKNALGLNNKFADSLLNMAAEADKGNFFDILSVKAKAFGNTLLALLKNPVFLSVAGMAAAGAVFKFWYDYNKGLVEASRLTSQFTGLQGEEMKHYRNEVQALSDTYDKDFKETLIAVNAVSKQFGIGNAEALQLVRDGFIAGADANGQFLDNLKEYPAYFKEAGLSASQFIAITTQANQSGIYSDKGIDVIKEGNLRIREMTTATADALDSIGISSKEVMEGLRKGELTTFEVMQKVSEKLNDLPENSSAVGTAIADIFGGPGEDAGLQYLCTLKDITTSLDDVKGKAGELGKVQEELLRSETELDNAVSDLFDSTGGFFEIMTAKGKIFINDVLKGILNEIQGITTSVEELGEKRLRQAKLQGEEAAKIDIQWQEENRKQIERTAELYIKNGMDETKAYQKAKDERLAVLRRSVAIEEDELNSYVEINKRLNREFADRSFWKQGLGLERTNTEFRDEINQTFDLIEFRTASLASANYKIDFISDMDFGAKSDVKSGKTKDQIKAEEEAARKALEIRRELEESKIEIMDDGLEKELAKIELSYQKRVDAIKGNGTAENTLRINLEKLKVKALAEYEEEYIHRFEKVNIENRLSAVEKGSKEELDLRMRLLDVGEEEEKKAAESSGEDVFLIEQKYVRKRQELNERFASERNKKLEDEYASRTVLINAAMAKELDEIAELYKIGEMNTETYEKRKSEISQKYMLQQLKDTLKLAKIMADTPGLSPEDKLKIKEKVANAEIALANAVRDAEEDSIKDAEKEHKKYLAELKDSLGYINDITRGALGDTADIFTGLSKIIQDIAEDGKLSFEMLASAVIDVFSGINDIVQNSYGVRIEKIEEEQDANDEACDRDIERIERLAETGAISEEEAEARKRAAEEKTAAKNRELEKKKQDLARKQAIWDKATSIAQAGIATALAITKSLPNFVLAAIVGAMGAIQVATIAATPIPSYAEGTKDGAHPGGKALVGDAGKREVVMYKGMAWITPDTPMLVDLPKGAQVFPDVDDFGSLDWQNNSFAPMFSFLRNSEKGGAGTTVYNDYSGLERRMDMTNNLLVQSIKQRRREAYKREFDLYILRNS
jgi:hypothetical protein